MGYNIVDIIDKAIKVAKKRKILITSVGEKSNTPSIKVMSKVLVKESNKTIKYYEELKKEISDIELEEIDFYKYDKMSFLIDDYNKRLIEVEVKNTREYLRNLLQAEKDVYAVFVDVRGRFVNKASDTETKTYKILSKIIDNKYKNIKELEKVIK